MLPKTQKEALALGWKKFPVERAMICADSLYTKTKDKAIFATFSCADVPPFFLQLDLTTRKITAQGTAPMSRYYLIVPVLKWFLGLVEKPTLTFQSGAPIKKVLNIFEYRETVRLGILEDGLDISKGSDDDCSVPLSQPKDGIVKSYCEHLAETL